MIERAERLIEPVPLLDDQVTLLVRVPCEDCHGTAIRDDVLPGVRCRECGRDYSEVAAITPQYERQYWVALPCGHDWAALTMPGACLMCVGTGWIEQRVNLGAIFHAWQAWQEAHQTPAPVALPSRPRTRRAATKVSA